MSPGNALSNRITLMAGYHSSVNILNPYIVLSSHCFPFLIFLFAFQMAHLRCVGNNLIFFPVLERVRTRTRTQWVSPSPSPDSCPDSDSTLVDSDSTSVDSDSSAADSDSGLMDSDSESDSTQLDSDST